MSPAEHVGTVLRYMREQGFGFAVAWAKAVGSLPRPDRIGASEDERREHREWLAVLRECRGAFRDAYETCAPQAEGVNSLCG